MMKSLLALRLTSATALCLAIGLTGCATSPSAGVSTANPAVGTMSDPSFGRYQVYTMPLPEGIKVQRATFTPSGKVLIDYTEAGDTNRNLLKLATLNPDGTGMRPFFAQELSDVPTGGVNLMILPDDRRIYTGDYVIECQQALALCENPQLLPVEFPDEVAKGRDYISHHRSEVIVSPDNEHVAWTALLSNYSAMVFTGKLEKHGSGYRLADPQIISSLHPFKPDPGHPDGVLPQPVRGGEVKQFVSGGTAISLVGIVNHALPDSTVQHLSDGRIEAITNTPGYTETTIFSPDERLGMTMTTGFSEKTDMAVVGLMPRPYPDSLNIGLARYAYTYGVSGVRRSRPGNIGPALIDISKAKKQDGYLGANLSTDESWVYESPMSWHPSGKMAMWQERRRQAAGNNDEGDRIQIVRLLDYAPGAAPAVRPWSLNKAYTSSDLSVAKKQAAGGHDLDVKVYGRASGYLTYRRTAGGTIEKVYYDFSDDGRSVYSGSERMEGNPRGRSTYTAAVALKGPTPGEMKLKMTFGPLGGELPSRIIFEEDASGRPLSFGYAQYGSQRLEVGTLVP
ncbi:hypothetical protein ABVV53_13280 [Novosphingobium sp. RD2P27]|uniref:Uncharacterized protein n=1 Tax=Novosphingobium kalidii TaxID=3230299 RepID=A0ABV2D3H5_9SPHN